MIKLKILEKALRCVLGEYLQSLHVAFNEITIVVKATDYPQAMLILRDHSDTRFEEAIDLFGIDYSTYNEENWNGPRFAIVLHLLSLEHNWRVRVRVSVPDDENPILASLIDIWTSVNWYEREAFDLFGILFEGHNDLRRLLTDYGFTGHPFRKDFPISGYVEMRYDFEKKCVIYQPVTIEPRETTPRVIREENYGVE